MILQVITAITIFGTTIVHNSRHRDRFVS